MPEQFKVGAADADQRLDKLLRQRFPALSFGQTQKLIRGGRVRVDSKRARAADRIAQGAMVTLPYQGAVQAPASRSQDLVAFQIYEDASLIALNKPAGLAVQGGSAVKTHIAGLLAGTELRLVHRLDRDTSGLLLLGKGALMAKALTAAFADQTVQKSYLALVPSAVEDQGRLTWPLKKILLGGEARMAPAPKGQAAVTEYQVLARSKTAALLRLAPRTGRTHQLRVHCTEQFGGIFGDHKYGAAKDRASGLCLHAWRVALAHPETREPLALEAPLPRRFQETLVRHDLGLAETWSPI